MNWTVALRLGRVSNLPTVWSNVLAGGVLAGGSAFTPRSLPLLLVAISLFYGAGMYLNDAFDRAFDATTYPQRPIPSGAVSARTVFVVGFLGLAMGIVFIAMQAHGEDGRQNWPPVVAALCLATTIVLYSAYHKNGPFGPFLMGLCRAQVYVTTGLAVTSALPLQLWWGAGLLLAYTLGLSYVARQETLAKLANLWPLAFLAAPLVYAAQGSLPSLFPMLIYLSFLAWVVYAVWRLVDRTQTNIREGVSTLIAGIALLDALLISLAGGGWLAALAVTCALLTRLAHRVIPGT